MQGNAGAAGTRALRVLFFAGPGDVVGTFRHWRDGRDDPGQVAMTYSGQFFDVCRDIGAEGYAIAYHPRRDSACGGALRVEHRAIPFIKSRSAALYHLGQVWSALRVIATALRFGADAVVIYDGTCHWFPLRVLAAGGVQVIPSIHCTFWTPGGTHPGRLKRLLRALDRPFWRHGTAMVLSASRTITQQLWELSGGCHAPVIEFLPTYRPGTFPPPSAPSAPPFRVLYAGRIERVKGVFDLLEIARRFDAERRTDIEFDLCGAGSAMDELKRAADALGLAGRFRLHGHCQRPLMRQMLERCHVLIVPTRTDFAEGFNQVVVEGVLAGRPVITSRACPALDYVREAVIEVPPDDVAAYGAAIVRLSEDGELYERARRSGQALQSRFYDPSRGWAAALRQALARCLGV